MALLGLEEKRNVQLFVRPDLQGRSVSATVALPRDRVSTELRVRLQSLLEERFNGESVDYHLSFGETDPARFHFTVHVPEGEIPDVSFAELEREVIAAARTWDDALSDALVEKHGDVQGHAMARRYAGSSWHSSTLSSSRCWASIGPTWWRSRTSRAPPSR